ncbi:MULTISPECIES: hypothetical protein [Marinomonas]|uniref:Hippurate hydrolase n=1 Tax=Marinomonas rhodophyticola TaxID=2992803 RepID=A0ABT3KNP1_9GAMM|nr:hypothetical protein [Marinomonas sp. KJ51-3]MCW4631652.1 hypothetical protein [Marinomonas sp. KJ51-3]
MQNLWQENILFAEKLRKQLHAHPEARLAGKKYSILNTLSA